MNPFSADRMPRRNGIDAVPGATENAYSAVAFLLTAPLIVGDRL